ncbi:hypothetical protein DOTSEDRAFT_68166 [Dothistroma septosporum NZE10]|uniref:HTH CENPB-type domain-containing protein n=1 Tax=Dothistroma septosporum (strain NZE10 / CBS 128990) TaxID=675120 RepID=N1Q0V1_DOTSN|nr:hypothetical protein DOTSEDRAFT_68166 [Dothistroma septosporum NZE10]
MADDDRNTAYRTSPQSSWGHNSHIYPHSHHGTPAQEYTGFNFTSPSLPMEPSAFSSSIQSRSIHQQLQPLVMPQWPSMLNSQAHSSYQPMFPQPVQPIQPMSFDSLHTPVSATSTRSTSTPRKTLTDMDRKRMCQYAEEHPNAKQTEIGAIFGVERSTVSKVLRQKEKYLFQDDGSRSPIKRTKGRSPDIERALAVWAKNQERRGLPLTDDLIRDKARAFSATTTTPDHQVTLSASWIEKFKLKNNLMGARSRKASLAADEDSASAVASSSHTPGDASPVSPSGVGSASPLELHHAPSQDSLKNGSPDSYLEFGSRRGPFHSQSTNSLNSAFTDTAPSSFSPGPLSPTSPFFTPDSGTAPSPFVPPAAAMPILPARTSVSSHRPRSQTFPLPEQYMSSAESITPKYGTSGLDSPMEEPQNPLGSIDTAVDADEPLERPPTVTPSDTMRPPPLPAHVLQQDSKRESHPLYPATTPDEARRALEVVLGFFEQQPHGFLDLQESVTIGKLMEKLKLQSRGGS